MELRRRTDLLPPTSSLPQGLVERARVAATSAVDLCGFDIAVVVHVSDRDGSALCAAAGRGGGLRDFAVTLAAQPGACDRALRLTQADDERSGNKWSYATMPFGAVGDGQLLLVVGDPGLSRREAEALAVWSAPTQQLGEYNGGACDELAHRLAVDHNGDVVCLALYAQAGILVNYHVRSGLLLRSWRCPTDTVWGEAASHGAAFVLGELGMHSGMESLASLGMQHAAIVGLENGSSIPIGSCGVASAANLDVDIAHQLLVQAPELGPRIMGIRSSTPVPRPNENGVVELRSFAARVGCRRFALYSRAGDKVTLVSAHAEDGTVLVSPPDPYEQQLVVWAAERGAAVSAEHAAAVTIGDDTVLYAQDPKKKPLECLRLALHDLRADPYGKAA